MKKSKTNIIAFSLLAILLVFCAGFMIYQKSVSDAEKLTAVISVDGVDVAKVELSEDKAPYEVSLNEIFGADVVLEVKDHAIRFKSSDCPDQICVHAGWLSRDMDIAVCMPNQVAIVVQPAAELQ